MTSPAHNIPHRLVKAKAMIRTTSLPKDSPLASPISVVQTYEIADEAFESGIVTRAAPDGYVLVTMKFYRALDALGVWDDRSRVVRVARSIVPKDKLYTLDYYVDPETFRAIRTLDACARQEAKT